MQKKQNEKLVNITSEVPEEETGEEYPVYTNNGTIHVPISGNSNTVYVYIMNGKPPDPPPPPGGGNQ